MDRKTAKDHLRKLQKKLIINCTSAQSFYTKFNERSSKIMDLSKINDY
jgi:hypothetical protein